MAILRPDEINVLRAHARMGYTLSDAVKALPRRVDIAIVRREISGEGMQFRRERQPLKRSQWVAQACRDYHPDQMSARQSNRERGRVRYRVKHMGMDIADAVSMDAMTPAEKGRLGALKRWGKPLVTEESDQLTWRWL